MNKIETDPKFPNKSLIRYETALGIYYLPSDSNADCIAEDMRNGRIFEPEVVSVCQRYIKPGTVVLDVGSNFGQMALLFSKTVGKDGQVLAFEADDFVYSVMLKNLEANNADNVKGIFGAVHERSGLNVFYPVQDFSKGKWGAYGSYGIEPKATSGRTVPTITIDDLKIDREISFMKVDVQGCDLFAMRGAKDTINKYRMPILFEFEEQFQTNFGTCWQDYINFIKSIGYRIGGIIYDINYFIVPE